LCDAAYQTGARTLHQHLRAVRHPSLPPPETAARFLPLIAQATPGGYDGCAGASFSQPDEPSELPVEPNVIATILQIAN
jgi:hypothetical protein